MSRDQDREDQHLKDALTQTGRAWGSGELPDDEILHVRPPKPKKKKPSKREE